MKLFLQAEDHPIKHYSVIFMEDSCWIYFLGKNGRISLDAIICHEKFNRWYKEIK